MKNLSQLGKDMEQRKKKAETSLKRVIPRLIGNEHMRGFKKSFKLGRFNDFGTATWETPQRKKRGAFPPPTSSHVTRSTLVGKGGGGMSGLQDSFKVTYRGNEIIVENTKGYAELQNDGGTVTVTVTNKMRKFAWAMYYKAKKRGATDADSWKGLALTKKKTIKMTIPARKFMGHSNLIDKEVDKEIEIEMNEIFK